MQAHEVARRFHRSLYEEHYDRRRRVSYEENERARTDSVDLAMP
jgi:hypothetical protein